jgi:hypothetical protein
MMMIADVDPRHSKAEHQQARRFYCACTFKKEEKEKD